MRIISGKFKGRNLANFSHFKLLRPTTDRNRETLFNILSSAKFIKETVFSIEGASVLDLCCGSGALAFEALSRGAKCAVLVDNNRNHLELAKKNAKILGLQNEISFIHSELKNLSANEQFFDLVFLDPPYKSEYPVLISDLLNKSWVKTGSLLIIELPTNQTPISFSGLKLLELRKCGRTSFAFLIKYPAF